jgi:dienelactone hydrolase
MDRTDLRFPSGDGECAAWLYRPAQTAGPAPCVVMGHGFSLTRHDGLAPYAERFVEAGAAVLAFDYRHFGDSPGVPRQRFRRGLQLADWRSAIAFARRQEGVDPDRIALWAFSFGCAHAVDVAAEDPRLAAVLALCPMVDGRARALATPPSLSAWITPRAVADALGRHTTVPVTAPPGGRAAMTLPGEADGFARAVGPASPWRNKVTPAIFLTVATVRPVTKAERIAAPLWVGLGDRDITVSEKAVTRLATRAPRGELHRYPYDHFDAFVGDGPQRVAADQAAFLRRAVLGGAAATSPAAG